MASPLFKAAMPHLVVAALTMLSPVGAMAANYDEALNGDLSNNGLAPTTLALDPGSNLVQGHFGISPVPALADLDYLSVVAPSSFRLSRMTLAALNPGGANSFLGVQNGSQLTMPPNSLDPSPLLGWNHIYANQTGSDLLPALGITGGLAPGSYTFWINETDKTAAWSYGFVFEVTPVPEPPEHAMLGLGLGLLGYFARRNSK